MNEWSKTQRIHWPLCCAAFRASEYFQNIPSLPLIVHHQSCTPYLLHWCTIRIVHPLHFFQGLTKNITVLNEIIKLPSLHLQYSVNGSKLNLLLTVNSKSLPTSRAETQKERNEAWPNILREMVLKIGKYSTCVVVRIPHSWSGGYRGQPSVAQMTKKVFQPSAVDILAPASAGVSRSQQLQLWRSASLAEGWARLKAKPAFINAPLPATTSRTAALQQSRQRDYFFRPGPFAKRSNSTSYLFIIWVGCCLAHVLCLWFWLKPNCQQIFTTSTLLFFQAQTSFFCGYMLCSWFS